MVTVEKLGVLLSSCLLGAQPVSRQRHASAGSSQECFEVGSLCKQKPWTPGKTTECLLKPRGSHSFLLKYGLITTQMSLEWLSLPPRPQAECVGAGSDAGKCGQKKQRTVTFLYISYFKPGRMVLILCLEPHVSIITEAKPRIYRPGPSSNLCMN